MRSTALACALAVLAAHAARAQEEGGSPAEEPVSGSITSREAATEILPEPPPVGRTIRTPHGWWRIESGEAEPGATGSFTAMRVPAPAPPAAPEARAPAEAPPPAPAPEAPPAPYPGSAAEGQRCFDEKEAYSRELFRIAGIWHFDRPLELVEGLEATPGLSLSPWVRFNVFGLATGGPLVSAVGVDPVRPVGWDEGLRWAAEDLIDCIRRGWSNAAPPFFEH
ncbi:MAG TPA: hypothetical protein VN033_10850 [Vulgatibacter sp.]|nr:hypothetical protein [Vulgatibacter sp.]